MPHFRKDNVNIGLLGHVDCGKTSLAKALSSHSGTACFDKSPQSQERGITLDLGFSAFEHGDANFTVVDCPGHASLFKTVLCGAQIIDVFLLVIDAAKGMQAQTAECWVLAEILAERLVVVLNKSDSVDVANLGKLAARIKSFLATSRFKDAPIVCTSAANSTGISELKDVIASLISKQPIERSSNRQFVFVVDHCFNLRGHGTVLTGTVLFGALASKQHIRIPALNIERKVKSMQSFKQAVESIRAGDRVGICVPSLEAGLIERTLVCCPEAPLLSSQFLLVKVRKVPHFKQQLPSKIKIHITLLNETVLAKQVIFVKKTEHGFEYLDELVDDEAYAVIALERPILYVEGCTVIAARLDFEPSMKQCRIAFHGKLTDRQPFSYNDICIYCCKARMLLVDRINTDERRLVAYFEGEKKALHSVAKFLDMKVDLLHGKDLLCSGTIVSTFGTSGKVNVSLHKSITDFPPKCELQLRLEFAKTLFQDQKKTFQLK